MSTDVASIELYRATLELGARNKGTSFTPEQSRELIAMLDALSPASSSSAAVAWMDAALKLSEAVRNYAWLYNNGPTGDLLRSRREVVQLAYDIRERQNAFVHLAAHSAHLRGNRMSTTNVSEVTVVLTDEERRALAFAADLGIVRNERAWPSEAYRATASEAREKLIRATEAVREVSE